MGLLLRARFPDLKSLISAAAYEIAIEAKGSAARLPLAGLHWLPVIPNPDKILCVGLNYEKHRKETGRAEVTHPTIFARFASSQTAHLKNILRPRVSDNLDFEGELAVVMGKSRPLHTARRGTGSRRWIRLLQRRQYTRLAAPYSSVHAGEELSPDGRVRTLDDDAG